MFERFTERARQVAVFAQVEARRFGHDRVRSEHILLGLVREEQGLGARVLRTCGITDDRVGARLGEAPWVGRDIAVGPMPFSARAQHALELAAVEADALGCEMTSTHHLLLGLLRVTDGGAVRVLAELAAHPPAIREQVLSDLSVAPAEWPASVQQLADFRNRRAAAPSEAQVPRELRLAHHEQAINTAQQTYRRADTDRQRTLAREQIESLESIRHLVTAE